MESEESEPAEPSVCGLFSTVFVIKDKSFPMIPEPGRKYQLSVFD